MSENKEVIGYIHDIPIFDGKPFEIDNNIEINGIKQNSLEAYREINSDGTSLTQRQRVLLLIERSDGLTRQDISRALGIPINSVCGRCKELLKSAKIIESGNRLDQITKKNNAILKVILNG